MTRISARRAEVLASYGIKQKKVKKKKKEANDDLPVHAPIRMRCELEKVDKVTAIRKVKEKKQETLNNNALKNKPRLNLTDEERCARKKASDEKRRSEVNGLKMMGFLTAATAKALAPSKSSIGMETSAPYFNYQDNFIENQYHGKTSAFDVRHNDLIETDPETGKKIITDPDLEHSYQKKSGFTFHTDMQSIATGPFGINEIGLGGENKSMEIAKYDKASYEAVGKRLAGGNWKDFESVVKNPSLAKASSHPRFQEYKSLHRRIEKEASIYKAISEDIKIQSAQYLESGKPEAARISEAGKVNKQTISDYFSGKYPGASFANVESASIYGGKSLSEQAKLSNLPSGNLPGGQPVDKPIDVTAGQGSKPKIFTSPGGRTVKSGLPSYGEQKVVSGGYVRSYDKPNTVFPRSPLETTQQKKIDENLKALRQAMKKAAAVGGGVGIRGIIGIGKKGGGGSAFSK